MNSDTQPTHGNGDAAGSFTPAQLEWLAGQVIESCALDRMTPEQLVDAALAETASLGMGTRLYNVIEEMMDRIDPTWTTRHAPKGSE